MTTQPNPGNNQMTTQPNPGNNQMTTQPNSGNNQMTTQPNSGNNQMTTQPNPRNNQMAIQPNSGNNQMTTQPNSGNNQMTTQPNPGNNQMTARMNKTLFGSMKLIGFIIAALLICTGPMVIGTFFESITQKQMFVVASLSCVNSVVNPFIYAFNIEKFRKELTNMCRKINIFN
jgi:hypothetical protein